MSRTIVIGDIHGCWDELRDLFDRVALAVDDVVVSVGDLVDRGPDPAAVVDWFRRRPGAVVLMGNHERKHVRGVFSYSQQVTRAQLGARYDDDVAWMGTLPYHLERPDLRAVHFGLYPGVPLDEVPEDVRAGTTSGEAKLRERYGDAGWWAHYTDDVPVAFGHHVVGPEPLVVRDRVFGLDTGACHGLALTALVLPERALVSVPSRADHWKQVRDAWQEPVLRTHPWGTMTWQQIEKKVRSLRDPELGGAFLDGVLGWADAVRATIPRLADALDREVARLLAVAGEEGFGRVAAAHPAGSWLLRHRAGRLSREHLGCAGPAQALALAQALGVDPGVAPAP